MLELRPQGGAVQRGEREDGARIHPCLLEEQKNYTEWKPEVPHLQALQRAVRVGHLLTKAVRRRFFLSVRQRGANGQNVLTPVVLSRGRHPSVLVRKSVDLRSVGVFFSWEEARAAASQEGTRFEGANPAPQAGARCSAQLPNSGAQQQRVKAVFSDF